MAVSCEPETQIGTQKTKNTPTIKQLPTSKLVLYPFLNAFLFFFELPGTTPNPRATGVPPHDVQKT
jgi:hypothetical protein